MYQQVVQQIVDGMILVMASILIAFTLLLIVLHFITNTTQERMQRIRQQILRLISSSEQIEYMKGQIYRAINSPAEQMTLQGIRGIRSRRGIQVLELVSRELDDRQTAVLRSAVSTDWYADFLQKTIDGRDKEAALLVVKLVGQLRISGYTASIEQNFKRWPKDAAVQEIGLLTLFIQGEGELLSELLSDPQFTVILSFRSLHELFLHYSGDPSGLYRELLSRAHDQYVRRACIRGIGDSGCTAFGEVLLPELASASMNVLLETIRTMGKLGYAPAIDAIRGLVRHEAWEVRCAAVDALVLLDKDGCCDAVLPCLYDKVWWVRFHAAEALAALPERDTVLAVVRAGTDRYAREMLEYVVERDEILEGSLAAS